jgi:hypothetical protein
MSQRKDRQRTRLSPVDQVLDDVRVIADWPFVRSVEDHFAGYFNELGITINLTDDASNFDVIQLRNKVLAYLKNASVELELEFTWQVSFWRNLQQIVLLFPSSHHHPAELALEQIY